MNRLDLEVKRMGKSVYIAEKPSVAKEFAKALKITGRGNDGFIENENGIVTWCVGHLVTMSYPEKYDPALKRWSMETLPFLPEKWKYEVIENVKKQLSLRRKQYEYYRDHLLNPASLPNAEIKTVLDVADIYSGLTYKPDNISNNGTLVLRSSNIRNNKLSFEDNVFVCMDIPKRAIVKKDDILICVRNGSRKLIGKCAMITKEADGMAFGAFMAIVRSPYNPYILHFINSS